MCGGMDMDKGQELKEEKGMECVDEEDKRTVSPVRASSIPAIITSSSIPVICWVLPSSVFLECRGSWFEGGNIDMEERMSMSHQ